MANGWVLQKTFFSTQALGCCKEAEAEGSKTQLARASLVAGRQ